MRETAIAFEAATRLDFSGAVSRARAELQKEGFGVLTEIDLQAKLLEKLGVATEPYLILGACHPPSAHRAVAAAPEVGVLLPCNVTVSVEHGITTVRAMNPAGAMQLLDNPQVNAVAAEVGTALQRVIAAVESA